MSIIKCASDTITTNWKPINEDDEKLSLLMKVDDIRHKYPEDILKGLIPQFNGATSIHEIKIWLDVYINNYNTKYK